MSAHKGINRSKRRKVLGHLRAAAEKQRRGLDLADSILVFVDSEGIMNAYDKSDCNICEVGFVIAVFWRAGKAAPTDVEHQRKLRIITYKSAIMKPSEKFHNNKQHAWACSNVHGVQLTDQEEQGITLGEVKDMLFVEFCKAMECVHPPESREHTDQWLRENVLFIYKNGGQGDLHGLDTRWCDDLASTLGVVQFDIDDHVTLTATLDPYMEPMQFIPMHHGSRPKREMSEAYCLAHRIQCKAKTHRLRKHAYAEQPHCVLADCMEALYGIAIHADAKIEDDTELTQNLPHPSTIRTPTRVKPLERRMPSIPRWAQRWYASNEYATMHAAKRQREGSSC